MTELAFERLHKPKTRDTLRDQDHARKALLEQATRAPDPGDPLSPVLRADLEKKFDRDLGHIRVHTSAGASRTATEAGALAFTRGAHIFLASPQTARSSAVLAHELTHAVQQGAVPPVRFASGGRQALPGSVPRAAPAPATAQAGPAAPAQPLDLWDTARSVGGAVGSGIRATAGAIADVGSNFLDMSRDALMGVVRRVAPDFLPMFEGDGIDGFIRKLIESGLRTMFDGLTVPLRAIIDVDALSATFRSATEGIRTIIGQLAEGDCSGILEAAAKVGAFFRETLGPVVDSIKGISKEVEGFFRGIWDSIGLPIMDVLKKIGGEIWDSLKGFVSDLAALIRRVRGALGSAWQTVKGWLGIQAEDGEGEGGGLWNWVRDKASAIGKTISDTIRPVMGPLKKVGAVLLLIVPGGQMVALIALWPDLKRAFDWVSKKWDDLNLIPRAREELANVIIPLLLDTAERVGKALIDGTDWLLGMLDEFHGALARAAEAAVGILTPLRRLIHFVREKSHALIQWARGKLQQASKNMHALLGKLIAFMGKVGDALKELIAAIVNPFGIAGLLAGYIWLALPRCLKEPIIEFLLDVLDAFIEALPSSPWLGVLWPVMKAALTGFVRKVKKVPLEEKIRLADKIAKIISGQSFKFAIGFLKGIVIGIWEEITAPFRALAAIFDLPEKITKFLSDFGVSFCEIVENVRCFLATLAQSVFGKLDDVLGALQEYLENPSKILDLITCAAQGALTAAASLGEAIADEMIKIFRSSDEEIGEQLGKFTGGIIVQSVISFFTAGVGAGASIVAKIANLLGSVGKAIAQVLEFITQQIGKLIRFVKGFIARIGSAIVKGAKSIVGKMKGFFEKVFAWFKRVFGKLFARVKKKFMLTASERLQWTEFQALLKASLAPHQKGITRRELRTIVKRHLQSFKKVAKWPAFITKHGPNWRFRVRRVKSLKPRVVAEVPLDPAVRLRAGTREAKKKIKLFKATHEQVRVADFQHILDGVRARFHFTAFTSKYDDEQSLFKVHGEINPDKNWKSLPKRPGKNVVTKRVAHRSVTIDPLAKLQVYSPPKDPDDWDKISAIKAAPKGTVSLYVRGHIGHGRFINGDARNIMSISRSANKLMHSRAEGAVIKALGGRAHKRPVFKYVVTTTDPAPATLRPRLVGKVGGGNPCRVVKEERKLVRSINITMTSFSFNSANGKWDRPVKEKAETIDNVPSYPAGHKEPC